MVQATAKAVKASDVKSSNIAIDSQCPDVSIYSYHGNKFTYTCVCMCVRIALDMVTVF